MSYRHVMRRKIPTLQALTCFEAAARHESYTRAADELCMTQGAVSRQMAALETYLGLALFRRTRHGVALTSAGEQYARQVRQRLDHLERDTLDAMSSRGEGGSLQIAVVPTLAARWLIPRLPRLQALHPDLVVHIEARTRPFLFGDTDFEAAICPCTPAQLARWAGTQATALMPEVVLPVCRPDLLPGGQPVSPETLATLPLLQPSTRPDAWRTWLEGLGVQAAGVMAGPRYELFSMQAAAAAQGLGVALVPRLLVEEELARGLLVQACDRLAPVERDYYLFTPEGRADSPALAQFRVWLQAEVSAEGVRERATSAP